MPKHQNGNLRPCINFIKTEFCDLYNKGGTKNTRLFPYIQKCPHQPLSDNYVSFDQLYGQLTPFSFIFREVHHSHNKKIEAFVDVTENSGVFQSVHIDIYLREQLAWHLLLWTARAKE